RLVRKEPVSTKARKIKAFSMKKPSIYILEITLLHTAPAVWRVVEIKENFTLHELHAVIQEAMGWTNSHLYSFIEKRNGNEIEYTLPEYRDLLEESQEGNNPRLIKLKDIFREVGDSLVYLYDYGDYWEHKVLLKGKRYPDTLKYYPVCTAGAMACPPEDIGGIHRYKELLHLINIKAKKELKEYREWLGENFDPYKLE